MKRAATFELHRQIRLWGTDAATAASMFFFFFSKAEH